MPSILISIIFYLPHLIFMTPILTFIIYLQSYCIFDIITLYVVYVSDKTVAVLTFVAHQ